MSEVDLLNKYSVEDVNLPDIDQSLYQKLYWEVKRYLTSMLVEGELRKPTLGEYLRLVTAHDEVAKETVRVDEEREHTDHTAQICWCGAGPKAY